MEKSTFEQMGGTYHQEGDYYIPDVIAPETVPLGRWGRRHLQHIKEHRNGFYTAMKAFGNLDAYLADFDRYAEDLYAAMMESTAEAEGITEQLKAEDQLAWVGAMNNVRNQVEEFMIKEIVCT